MTKDQVRVAYLDFINNCDHLDNEEILTKLVELRTIYGNNDGTEFFKLLIDKIEHICEKLNYSFDYVE